MSKHDKWWDQMACNDPYVEPTIFDERVTRGGRPRKDGRRTAPPQDWSEARAVCGSCPVRNQCLENYLTLPPPPNMPGARHFVAGYTPDELDTIRRRRAS